MLWYVEERKPAAIRRPEVVDCFDEDLDCLIAGIRFDANLCVFKIYLVSTTIVAADNGVRHVAVLHGFQPVLREQPDPRRRATDT
jgi:hypothetical protein